MLENRLFVGGLNTDDSDALIGNHELLNAVNVRANTSAGQNSQALQFIEGNVEITAVTNLLAFDPTEGKQSYELIGKTADEVTGKIYMFLCHVKTVPPAGGLKHCIVSYDPATNTALKIFTNQMVGATLAWTANTFIDCAVASNKLFWVDPTPRYLDLSVNYATEYTTPFSDNIISLITEPGYVPALVNNYILSSATTNNIQTSPTQYTYRFRNKSGFTSVLAPYSLTNLPQRTDALAADPLAGNAIKVTIPITQTIPLDWEQIEIAVRYTDGNQFYVIKQFNRGNPIDFAQVQLHIAGAQPLYFENWTGQTLYTLDSTTIGKQFDSVPLTAKSLALMANRLFLGNIVEGYDTPVEKPNVTVTKNSFGNINFIIKGYQTYLITGKEKDKNNFYAAVVYYDTSNPTKPIYRLLPKEYSVFTFTGYENVFHPDSPLTPPNVWQNVGSIKGGVLVPPRYIPYDSCITLKTQSDLILSSPGWVGINGGRIKVLKEVHGEDIQLETSVGAKEIYLIPYYDISIITVPNVLSKPCFMPSSVYMLGMTWYDKALRKTGSLMLDNVQMGNMGYLVESISVTKPTVPAPSFAEKYAITLSKSSSKIVTQFVAGTIYVAMKSTDGVIQYIGYNELEQYIPQGCEVYATAIPLNSLSRYNYGYDYLKGDFVQFDIFYNVFPTVYPPLSDVVSLVLGAQDGYLLVSYINNPFIYSTRAETLSATTVTVGSESSTLYKKINDGLQSTWTPCTSDDGQCLCVVTINRAVINVEKNLYEVAVFGDIFNGVYGNFYNQVNPTVAVIKGDYYQQKRTANAGEWSCVSYTPNEKTALFECNNLGRIAPFDEIGQQEIPTGLRWSNTNKIGAAVSGYGSFDYADFAAIDVTAGGITKLLPIAKGVSEGGQLLMLCDSNSFVAYVGKSQLFGADQTQAAITSTAETIGEINPITGAWGCQSPRTAVYYKGLAFFADVRNKVLVQFGGNGATPVSRNKTARLFKQLFGRAMDVTKLTGSINPYTYEYMLFVPASNPTTKPLLPTTNLQNPLDAYYGDSRVYLFDWTLNKITGSWEVTDEMWHVGDKVFGWNGKLWQEFKGAAGVYGGVQKQALVTMPFNNNYPLVKTHLSLSLDCDLAPTQTWVIADGMGVSQQGVANVSAYEYRESNLMASIGGNRLSNNANTTQQYNNNFVDGDKLKGKTAKIVLIWQSEFHCVSATLHNNPSSGQLLNTK